jgi:hypothetical protein
LKFDSEAGILEKRDEKRTQAAQMKLLRHLLGITTFDRKGNQSIREKLGVQDIARETEHYKKVATAHTEWSETGYPSRHCSINRRAGRPRKGWRDQLHLVGQGTGTTSNPLGFMMMMMMI